MAEIILEPTALSKVIPLSLKLNEVDSSLTGQLVTKQQFNTADTDAWFSFTLDGLAATTGTFDLTLINLQDKSVFNHDAVAFNTNPFYYKLDSGADELTNEIRHAGKWVGQLVVTLPSGDSATRKFIFSIEGHILDGTVVQTILLEDYNALIADIEASKDELTQYNIDYASLIGTVTSQEASRVQAELTRTETFNALVDSEIIAQNVATELQNVEATYAPRLLSAEQQLAQTTAQLPEALPCGEIKLPSDFKAVPFKIYKDDFFDFRHTATPENQNDWSDAITVFIASSATTSGDGTLQGAPISLARFKVNVDTAVYGTTKKFILNIMEDVLEETSLTSLDNLSLYFKSISPSGFSWVGRYLVPGKEENTSSSKYASPWAFDVASGLYKTTTYISGTIIDIINFKDTEEYGDVPSPYTKVGDLASCQGFVGSFYQSGKDVYCNPFLSHDITNVMLSVYSTSASALTILNNDNSKPTTIFENIGFSAGQYTFNLVKETAKLYLFNCKFYRGLQDSAMITGLYQAYLLDCISAYGSKDCFNYHAGTSAALAVEVNCVGWGAGEYKLSGGNTTTHSNNGSTAHDGMSVLRVGSRYWGCEGPVVADVDNCYSINIGVNSGSVLPTTTGEKTSYYFDDSNTTKRPVLVNKYVVESKARKGHNLFGLVGTPNVVIVGLIGNATVSGAVQYADSWEDIV